MIDTRLVNAINMYRRGTMVLNLETLEKGITKELNTAQPLVSTLEIGFMEYLIALELKAEAPSIELMTKMILVKDHIRRESYRGVLVDYEQIAHINEHAKENLSSEDYQLYKRIMSGLMQDDIVWHRLMQRVHWDYINTGSGEESLFQFHDDELEKEKNIIELLENVHRIHLLMR